MENPAASSVGATSTATGGGNGDGPVNFIDVKLHGIFNVPPNWTGESGPPPVFNDHIFRYEVDMALVGHTHTFRNGRVLQTIPIYSEFIDGAKLPPPAGGSEELDDVPAQDAPEPAALPKAPSADILAPVAAPTAPIAGIEGAIAVAGATPNDANAGLPPTPGRSSAPAAILWVLGPEVDTEVREDLAGGKKEAKPAAKKGGPVAPVATQDAVVRPIPPNTTVPPTAMCRIPLTLVEISQLEDQLEKNPKLELTFRRVLRAGCPVDWEDAQEQRYQATLVVPLKPLLEPGSTFMQATVPLEPVAIEVPKDDEKNKAGKKAAPKKTKGSIPATLIEELDPNEPHPYVANRTHCVISIKCHVAVTRLPQARPRPDLQPSDLIPRRLRPPRRPADATKQFSREVEQLAWRIVRDFREHKQAAGVANPEALRQSFLQYLQTTGKTHVYRELLVPSVQGIVKETFIRKPSPSTEELDRVSSELYTYVLDQSHITLNRTFSQAAKAATSSAASSASFNPEGASPVDRWRRLALEAEVMRENAAAAKYHQECIVHSRGVDGDEQPDVWCEYAEFCLRVRDALKAEQAYREALAIDMAHMRSLIGYGALLLARHRFMEADVLLQSAVTISNDAMSWAFLAAYYDALLLSVADSPEEATRRAMCRRESKLAMIQAVRLASEAGGGNVTTEDMYQRLGARLLELHQEEAASMCLARSKPSTTLDMMNARLFYQTGQFDEAAAALRAIIDQQPTHAAARLLLGDVFAAMNRPSDAEAQYDHALRIDPNGGNGPSLVRLGNMYIALGKFKDALGAFLIGAKVWPCGLTWLGAGISYYRMDDLSRAEQALNEANILNNLNARTWGYLTLVCLRQRREEEGDQAFNQAIKQGLDDPYLTAEIGVEQFRLGRYKIAEACFRRSLALQDDCNTRMHLGRTLAALKRLPEARDEFAFVARTTANEAQRQRAEEQVAQLPMPVE